MFKVHNKTPERHKHFTTFSPVYIVEFEQVNVTWVIYFVHFDLSSKSVDAFCENTTLFLLLCSDWEYSGTTVLGFKNWRSLYNRVALLLKWKINIKRIHQRNIATACG